MNKFLLVFLAILLIESVLCTCLKYYFEGVHGNPDYVPEADSKAKVCASVCLFGVNVWVCIYVCLFFWCF